MTGTPRKGVANCTPANATLQECGVAPTITGISDWLNTPGDRPLTLADCGAGWS